MFDNLTNVTYIDADTDIDALLAPHVAKPTYEELLAEDRRSTEAFLNTPEKIAERVSLETMFKRHEQFINSGANKVYHDAFETAAAEGYNCANCTSIARNAYNNYTHPKP